MAQEVTFMMLRVLLSEIYRRYQLRLAPGATVAKNTVVTTKPAEVRVIRIPRVQGPPRPSNRAAQPPAVQAPAAAWGEPTEIPATSAYRHLVIAYGSNFGANKELAERFAERSDFHGYTSEVITLNELAQSAPRTQPWLLVVMTSTYTSNLPSNATAFKASLERTAPGDPTWRNCRYLVWGLGNTQWNAFLAFPRYVHARLSELGATPLAELAYGDVGSPVWERRHADWNARIWPVLLKLSAARPTQAAAARVAAEQAATGAQTTTDSNTAMHRSLRGSGSAPGTASLPGGGSLPGADFLPGAGLVRGADRPDSEDPTQPMPSLLSLASMLVPAILTNAVGQETAEAHVLGCRELQAAGSPKRTRHLEVSLPPGISYRAAPSAMPG